MEKIKELEAIVFPKHELHETTCSWVNFGADRASRVGYTVNLIKTTIKEERNCQVHIASSNTVNNNQGVRITVFETKRH